MKREVRVEIRQIKYFAKIVEVGGFSRAASVLHIAQPALSQQIANLEAEMGVKLLERLPTGAVVTPAGERLYRHAHSILRQIEQATQEVADSAGELVGRVALGLPMSLSSKIALPLVQFTRENYPRVLPQIFESANNLIAEMLFFSRVDMALLYGDVPNSGIRVTRTFHEELYFVAPPDIIQNGSAVSLETMLRDHEIILPAPETPLRLVFDRVARNLGLEPKIAAEAHSLDTIKSLIAAGIGTSILPWPAVESDVCEGRLSINAIASPAMSRPLSICISETVPLSRAASVVLDFVCDTLAKVMTERPPWAEPVSC